MVYPHTYRTEHSETVTTNAVYGEYYADMQSKKIRIQPSLLTILQYVDSHRQEFQDDLAESVAIKSVSSRLKYRDETIKMIKFTESWLIKVGMKYECFNIGYYELEGKRLRMPPVILAQLPSDPNKLTLCVYFHLDVKAPNMENWNTDPWKLTEIDNIFYGCGIALSKTPLMAWFHVIQAFQASKLEIPVNVKFIMESMYYSHSSGLSAFLATRKQDFLHDIDMVCVCESEWLSEKYPCLVMGCVGTLHFNVTIEKTENSKTDIKEDMERIFENITDNEENILIPRFNDYVQQITPDEEKVYEDIQEFDVEEIRDSLPPFKRDWDKVKLLMHFWRLPSIWVGPIEECICDKKDVSKIKRTFILKIVPRQVVDDSVMMTKQHIEEVVKDLKIENVVSCELTRSSKHWKEDPSSPNYVAARRATIQIYKEDPSIIREDRSRDVINILDAVIERNILLLPLGNNGINAGKDNANIPKRNYFEGTKLLAAYLFQLSYTKN